MAAGYGERAVEPKLRPNSGLSGVLSDVCVARQYASRYSARCSHASSSWFSSRIISNISWGGRTERKVSILLLQNNIWLVSASIFKKCIWCLLTEGHCASFSAATSCTFRCLLWDFPLDLINRWRTCGKQKKIQGCVSDKGTTEALGYQDSSPKCLYGFLWTT